jgi:hypothetical protein
VFVLLLAVLLSACEKSQAPRTLEESAIEPAVLLPEVVTTMPRTLPEGGVQQEPALPTLDSLDLRIKDRSLQEQTPPGFDAAPDSGWLDQGQDATGLDGEDDGLLPDLFAEKAQDKPVSVKGRVRLDDNVNTLSDTLDGAEVSIEVETDWQDMPF